MYNPAADYDALYTEYPERWDLIRIDETRFAVMAETLPEQPESLLDIGCGSGHTLEYFAKRWGAVQYYGIDPSPVAVKYARARIPGAFIRCETLEDTTMREMDVVLLGGVMEHVEQLAYGFYRLGQIVAKSGIVYLEVPNCIAYQDAHGEGFYRLREKSQAEWHRTRESWEDVILNNGFTIVRSVIGPEKFNEFIWILKRSEE